MTYEVIILGHLHMPLYFIGTFTEYPYNSHLLYWREKYNPGMGQIQHQVYNAYLKGNQVSSGTKNYSEVIGLLMSLQEDRIVL